MWASHAVSEEDRLDREQAKQVLRRAARLALPFRRPALKALVFIAMSTSSAVIGPLLLRYGIDRGIGEDDPGALNLAIALYVVVAIVAYLGSRQQYIHVNVVGEGFRGPYGCVCSGTSSASRWPSSTATRPACWCRA